MALVEPEEYHDNNDYIIKHKEINFLYDEVVARSARNILIDYQEIEGKQTLLVYNKGFKKEELKNYQAELN